MLDRKTSSLEENDRKVLSEKSIEAQRPPLLTQIREGISKLIRKALGYKFEKQLLEEISQKFHEAEKIFMLEGLAEHQIFFFRSNYLKVFVLRNYPDVFEKIYNDEEAFYQLMEACKIYREAPTEFEEELDYETPAMTAFRKRM